MKKCIRYSVVLVFSVMIMGIGTGISQTKDAPEDFAFDGTEYFREYTNFHGGTGTIRYHEYWGTDDYTTHQQFLRVVIIPPGSGIGEYRLADSDEVIALLGGNAYVTVNGRTGALVADTLVPVRMGESLGIYNPTDEDVSLVWVAAAAEKGTYNPVDLNTDLAKKRPEGVIPFPHIYMNYQILEPSGNPSHDGLGSLVETLGTVDFDYFTTGMHSRYFILPPGTSIGYHTHYTNEEHFFVVSGSGRGTVNNVTLPLNNFDCIKCGIDDSHGIYNNSSENLVIFFTNLPMPGVQNWGKVENLGDNLSDR